jgi:hypothetical protein
VTNAEVKSMKFKRLMIEAAYGIATIMGTALATVVGINLFGFVVNGRSEGYNSAQGGGTFYFMLSLMALPLAVILGIVMDRYFARRRRCNRVD